MKTINKPAKFFCENCGAEVPREAKMCRHCGRFFSSVRCPQCGTTGSPAKFASGCPNCGYAVSSISKSHVKKNAKRRKNSIDESLPWWIYFFVALVLFGVLALFLNFLR